MMPFHIKVRRFFLTGIAALVFAANILASAGHPASAGGIDAEKLKAVVRKHLRANSDYRPGDLICRADVEPIFNELIDQGLKTSGDIEDLYDSFLTEGSPLASALRTPPGRKFMRGVSSIPNSYDLLERLSWFTAGQQLLNELLVSPDGPQLFKTLLEPENLRELEQKLSSDPRARNLRLPTGHVYTANQLLDEMQRKFSASKSKKGK